MAIQPQQRHCAHKMKCVSQGSNYHTISLSCSLSIQEFAPSQNHRFNGLVQMERGQLEIVLKRGAIYACVNPNKTGIVETWVRDRE